MSGNIDISLFVPSVEFLAILVPVSFIALACYIIYHVSKREEV